MIKVKNASGSNPRVALFGRLPQGRFEVRCMAEDQVPYTKCWDDALEQVMVYIEPDAEQLGEIVAALESGRLEFARLQDYGGTAGGYSEIPT